ncbi:hypothetical protein ElyMa_000176900 [Elysia marginata]|uniref:Apple domain-containing protein n=1 Tax=Elysia marginata TaxID=1093978 RepID=A0AAV4EUV9_9GAST|nr:hypothetical protein ElyMa_000176900 [Elysia marginata]
MLDHGPRSKPETLLRQLCSPWIISRECQDAMTCLSHCAFPWMDGWTGWPIHCAGVRPGEGATSRLSYHNKSLAGWSENAYTTERK